MPKYVYVYDGKGVSEDSRDYCIARLKALVSLEYQVKTITPAEIAVTTWIENAVLFIMPGGATMPFNEVLQGIPNATIQRFVKNGGKYLGFCAGAYYGCDQTEFAIGNEKMELK